MRTSKPVLATLLALAACGSSTSGSPDAPRPPDAPADAIPLDAAPSDAPPRTAWSSPHKVWSGSTTMRCYEMSLSGDLLTMYASCGPYTTSDDYDVVTFTRTSAGGAWSGPTQIPELSTPVTETSAGVSPDELTLWFMRLRAGTGHLLDLYVTTRAARTDPWGTPVLVPEIQDAGQVAVNATGLAAVVVRFDAGTYDNLYLSTRADLQSAWSTPQAIQPLVSVEDDFEPSLSADQRELYYARTTIYQCTSDCLRVATRASAADAFVSSELVGELNAVGAARAPAISSDGHTIDFVVDEHPPQGPYDIYEATR